MREIKFRGLDVEGHWWYGELNPQGEYHINLANFFANAHAGAIRPETVGEYTGLKDKNDKEIYEGDIVTANYKVMTSRYSVVIRDGHTCLDARPSSSVLSFHLDIANTELYEVIGNITENPELLKEGR